MIYTADNRQLLTINELADVFSCSTNYMRVILDRFNTQKIRFKDKGYYIDFNDDFKDKLRQFMNLLHTKKSIKILEILDRIAAAP